MIYVKIHFFMFWTSVNIVGYTRPWVKYQQRVRFCNRISPSRMLELQSELLCIVKYYSNVFVSYK